MKSQVLFLVTFMLLSTLSLSAQDSSLTVPDSWSYKAKLEANGCGAKDGIKFPDLIFKEACDQHDIDFGSNKSFTEANFDFFFTMIKACRGEFDHPMLVSGCIQIGGVYFFAVQILGTSSYYKAQALKKNLEEAIRRESGMCLPNDVYVRQEGDHYYLAIRQLLGNR
jgi:hypothetical protein